MPNPANTSVLELQRAQRFAQSGDLEGAARICRSLLTQDSGNFFALLMLGGIESDRRNFEAAERLLQRAVRINPRSPEALGSYGNVLIERGRREDALQVLGEAIRLQPRNPATFVYRGFAHAQAGDHKKALADFDSALRLAPDWEFALHNRACALIALYRHSEARADVEKLLRAGHATVPVLINHALILTRDRSHEAALVAVDRALAIDSTNLTLRSTRADILSALGRFDEALTAYQALAAQHPDRPEYALGCAHIFMEKGRLDQSLDRTVELLEAHPDYAPALVLRANLLLHLERHAEARSAYDTAVAIGTQYPDARYHRGSFVLLHGRFTDGWEDFESRWDVTDCGLSRPVLKPPVWRGESLHGRSIIVYSEQGLGDTIQFVRFLPELAAAGARVTFLCHPNLTRLFRSFTRDGIEIIASCDSGRAFDWQCALMSLPQKFGTTVENLPRTVPYLFPEPDLVAQWRAHIGAEEFRIGICWQGNPLGPIDKGRSVPLAEFQPVAAIPGVRLISLQRTHGLDQLQKLPAGMKVETLGTFDAGEDAFTDTAAIMQSLDLIVASDTSVAHLAGALGRPVWLGVKHIPDWRWMLNRADSPWYPTMRIFRQPARGDWHGAFTEIAAAVAKLRSG